MRRIFAFLVLVLIAAVCSIARGQVQIGEAYLSSFGADVEYVELVNVGHSRLDLAGYRLACYISDVEDPHYGTWGANPYAPYVWSGYLDVHGAAAMGNGLAVEIFGTEAFGGLLPFNAFPNGAATLVLPDASGQILDAVFFDDGRGVNVPNAAGVEIVPSIVVGGVGAGGFVRFPDGSWEPLDFYAVEGTPGQSQDPGYLVSHLIAFLGAFRRGAADFDGDGQTNVFDLLGYLASMRSANRA